jgi:hypothetical protein
VSDGCIAINCLLAEFGALAGQRCIGGLPLPTAERVGDGVDAGVQCQATHANLGIGLQQDVCLQNLPCGTWALLLCRKVRHDRTLYPIKFNCSTGTGLEPRGRTAPLSLKHLGGRPKCEV